MAPRSYVKRVHHPVGPPITMSDVKTTPLELPQVQVTQISPAAPTTSNTQTTSYTPTAKQAPPATEYGPTKSRDTLWGLQKNWSQMTVPLLTNK